MRMKKIGKDVIGKPMSIGQVRTGWNKEMMN